MENNLYNAKFFDHFEIIFDKRQEGKVIHKLIDVLFIIVSATLCRMEDIEDIYEWAKDKTNRNWLKKYIELPNGIPSKSTIRRILNIIEPKQFAKCFVDWIREMTIYEDGKPSTISIDGKTRRGSKNGNSVTHIVSAFCGTNNLVLGQVKTAEKSNEITAIPELLDMLYLEGNIVTIDAMGCQKKIVEKIVLEKKADYVISLKGNQGTLHEEVNNFFDDLTENGKIQECKKVQNATLDKLEYFITKEKGHGRIESREYYYSKDIDWMTDAKKDWIGLTGIGMVNRKVTIKDKTTEEIQYYISSVDNVKDFSKAVREHWKIESMHWCLDVIFKEDANTTRKDVAPENLATVIKIVFNMLNNEKELFPKKTKKSKRLHAFMNLEYRTYVFDKYFKSL